MSKSGISAYWYPPPDNGPFVVSHANSEQHRNIVCHETMIAPFIVLCPSSVPRFSCFFDLQVPAPQWKPHVGQTYCHKILDTFPPHMDMRGRVSAARRLHSGRVPVLGWGE